MKYQVCWRGGKRRERAYKAAFEDDYTPLDPLMETKGDCHFFGYITTRRDFVFWHGGQCWGVVGGRETDDVAGDFAVRLALRLAAE